jgi:hypothetical protein
VDLLKVVLAAIALVCFAIAYRGQIDGLRERRARRKAERAALLLDAAAYLLTFFAIATPSIPLGVAAFALAAVSSFPSVLIRATGGPIRPGRQGGTSDMADLEPSRDIARR